MNTCSPPALLALRRGALLGLLLGWTIATLHANGLAPFKGIIQGVVHLAADGTATAPPAAEIACYLGRGVQVYDTLVIDPVDPTRLRAVGTGWSVAENGDRLQLRFILEGPLLIGEPIPYEGIYEVLPEGTGRFDYTGMSDGINLGRGVLHGMARITPVGTDGSAVIKFRHCFQGTLYLRGCPRGSYYRAGGGETGPGRPSEELRPDPDFGVGSDDGGWPDAESPAYDPGEAPGGRGENRELTP